MASDKIRRTLALPVDRRDELQQLKAEIGARTDTAAINEAVHFRARLRTRNLDEIERALSVWDALLHEISNNKCTVVIENPAKPNTRTVLAVPKPI
jgi:hypothetical protein